MGVWFGLACVVLLREMFVMDVVLSFDCFDAGCAGCLGFELWVRMRGYACYVS